MGRWSKVKGSEWALRDTVTKRDIARVQMAHLRIVRDSAFDHASRRPGRRGRTDKYRFSMQVQRARLVVEYVADRGTVWRVIHTEFP